MNLVYAALAALTLVLAAGPAYAGKLHELFGKGGQNPCVIKRNNGGHLLDYIEAATEVNRGACKQVEVDGPCLSACTVFLDYVNTSRVCVTKWARLGFHQKERSAWSPSSFTINGLLKGESVRTEKFYYPSYSPRLAAWLEVQREKAKPTSERD